MPDVLENLYEANFTSKTVKLNAKKVSSVFTANPVPDHLYYKFVNYFGRGTWQDRNFFTSDGSPAPMPAPRPGQKSRHPGEEGTSLFRSGKSLAELQDKALDGLAGTSIQNFTANGFDISQDGTVICSLFTRGDKIEMIMIWVDAESLDSKLNEERTTALYQVLAKAQDEKPQDWMYQVTKLLEYVLEQQNVMKAQTQHTSTHGVNLADL